MSTKEALEVYPTFAKEVFGHPKSKFRTPFRGGQFTNYSATVMEKAIKKIIVNRLRQEDAQATGDKPMLDRRPDACKT